MPDYLDIITSLNHAQKDQLNSNHLLAPKNYYSISTLGQVICYTPATKSQFNISQSGEQFRCESCPLGPDTQRSQMT